MSDTTVVIIGVNVVLLAVSTLINTFLLVKLTKRVEDLESRHSTKGKDVQP